MSNPTVTIKLENGKEIKAVLFSERAPSNIKFFLSYVETFYYEWVPFHTCIKDKAVALGLFEKHGRGYDGDEFDELFREDNDEYETVGSKEKFPYEIGTLALIEPKLPETSRQQLAILLTDEPVYAHGHEVTFRPIGKVTEGLEIAKDISQVEVDEALTPKKLIMIENIYVENN